MCSRHGEPAAEGSRLIAAICIPWKNSGGHTSQKVCGRSTGFQLLFNAFGSPAGLDNANTNAWSATSNTGRGVTGSVVNAVSSVGVVDAVGRVWEWLDELITRAEHATNADYHASVAWGWDKKSPLNTGEKSYDVGNIYQYYAYSVAALVAGGGWGSGALCGARAVICNNYPWRVLTGVGARGACDSL